MDNKFRVLVISGAWNMPLFTIDWINDYLFDGTLSDNIKPRYSGTSQMVVSKLFQFDNFEMGICPDRLCFIANQDDIGTLDKIADIAERIANLLPHTPYYGFSVNYQIVKDCVPRMFYTDEQLAGYMKNFESRSFSFTATQESNKKINITVSREASNMDQSTWEINHNYTVKNSAEFKEYFAVDIFEKNKKISQALMEAIEDEYGLSKQ